jgi:hypothetical protein
MGDTATITSKSGVVSAVNFNIGSTYAMFDTASSVSFMSFANTALINTQLGLSLLQAFSDATRTVYNIDCDLVDTLPQMTFTFGGKQFSIRYDNCLSYTQPSPGDWILENTVEGVTYCVSSIWGKEMESSVGFLIGNSILRGWYTVFDNDNGNIGLANVIRTDVSSQNLATIELEATDNTDQLLVDNSAYRPVGGSVVVGLSMLLAIL